MNKEESKQKLAEAVKNLFDEKPVEEVLKSKKEKADERRERDDYLWNRLVASFATLGNSAGAVLVTEENNYDKIRYENVRQMDNDEREQHFEQIFRECNVRYPERKADYLTRNVDRIEEMGGLAEAQREFEESIGKENKLDFLEQFLNIGEKYSRNILMDLYHPEVRDELAIDSRIQAVSKKLDLAFDERYPEEADFYRSVADKIGVEPWELDRILYNFDTEVKSEIARL